VPNYVEGYDATVGKGIERLVLDCGWYAWRIEFFCYRGVERRKAQQSAE